jgi:polysaccharide pyruvyl transferase CsaB
VVSGYYGCGNTGDEAVLAGIVESFARRAGNGAVEFTVLSQDPEDTKRRHGLNAVARMDAAVVRKALKGSDLLISGGGSLLQDVTSLRSLFYYLWVINKARSLGRPVMLYAQGIGPLRRKISRWLVRRAANGTQQITIRDEESERLLRQIGVYGPPIEVTSDPAFALKSAGKVRAREILDNAGAPANGRLIGIAIRPWKNGPSEIAYARMADSLAEDLGGRVVFLPMQPSGDLPLAESIASKCATKASIVKGSLSPQETVAVIGELNLLVAMRLHALIFGAMGGVPMVGLRYDPKVQQLMEVLGQGERTVDLAEVGPVKVMKTVFETLGEAEKLRGELLQHAQKLSERTLLNADRALSLVQD